MHAMRWTLALVALAAALPAEAQVYRFSDGVVRVRHGGDSSAVVSQRPRARKTVQSVAAPYVPPSVEAPVVEVAPLADPSLTPVVQPAWDRSAATPLLHRAAEQSGLHPALLEALVWQESRWHPNAVSPKGAIGLTQLMPGTARELGVDPRDPTANLFGGARYLRSLIDHFDGDLVKALAAYNAGVGRVEQAGGVPPIAETQGYVMAILRRATATLGRR